MSAGFTHRSSIFTSNFFEGLQNDHKALMKRIEAGLHQVHSMAGSKSPEAAATSEINVPEETDNVLSEPFLKVNLVSAASPAELAVRILTRLTINFLS